MPVYDDFEAEFLLRFPEFAAEFDTYYADYAPDEEIGNYIILSDFIEPKLLELADANRNEDVQKFFDFFEYVATWDHASDELIHIELAEWLLEPVANKNYFEQFAGPLVRAAVRTIEDYRAKQRLNPALRANEHP